MRRENAWRRQGWIGLVSILGWAGIAGLLSCSSVSESQTRPASAEPSKPKPAIDANNVMTQPRGYRSWYYVGTPLTPNDLNPPEAPFPEFHNVYIRPADFQHYAETGTFRDGTMLIKELVSIGSTQALSGNGFFEGEFIGLEATIKDSERFPNEPGNWAYFTFSHAKPPYPKTAMRQPTAACNSCHQQGTQAGAADDWVFVSYYPVLRAAGRSPRER